MEERQKDWRRNFSEQSQKEDAQDSRKWLEDLALFFSQPFYNKGGPNKTPPEGHQEVGPGDFQAKQISLKLLTWKVAGRSQVCSTLMLSVWVFLVHFLLKSSLVPLKWPGHCCLVVLKTWGENSNCFSFVSFPQTLLGTELCKRRCFCFVVLSEPLPRVRLILPHTVSPDRPSRRGELVEYGDQMHIEHNICKATPFLSVASLTKQDHLCASRHFRSNPGFAEMTKSLVNSWSQNFSSSRSLMGALYKEN